MASILIVDDDEIIRDTLCELLSVDHNCDPASTAREALAKLAGQNYDLMLTDISMPGLSGLELLRFVAQSYPSTSVIIISGISDEEHAQRLIELGAFDFLVKPFRLEAVEETVKRALHHKNQTLSASENN